MKKALFLALALSLVMAGAAMATVVGSPHDLSNGTGPNLKYNTTKVCIFCHAPHNAYVNPSGLANNTYPLWNHQLSSATYSIYNSDTMNASVSSWGGATMSKSALCMSCHDGTIALNNLYAGYNLPYAYVSGTGVDGSNRLTSTANLGTDLGNDHPVNFTYDTALATADGGLVTPSSSSAVGTLNLPLFQGTVQCASCHNAHDNTTYRPFLRATQAASALCTNCHNK